MKKFFVAVCCVVMASATVVAQETVIEAPVTPVVQEAAQVIVDAPVAQETAIAASVIYGANPVQSGCGCGSVASAPVSTGCGCGAVAPVSNCGCQPRVRRTRCCKPAPVRCRKPVRTRCCKPRRCAQPAPCCAAAQPAPAPCFAAAPAPVAPCCGQASVEPVATRYCTTRRVRVRRSFRCCN